MNTKITTHKTPPASYHTLDALAVLRAAQQDEKDDELDCPVQSWRMAQVDQIEAEKKELEQQIKDAEKQADLDRQAMQLKLTNTEYQLRKAQAERMACVIALVVIVALVFVRGCSL